MATSSPRRRRTVRSDDGQEVTPVGSRPPSAFLARASPSPAPCDRAWRSRWPPRPRSPAFRGPRSLAKTAGCLSPDCPNREPRCAAPRPGPCSDRSEWMYHRLVRLAQILGKQFDEESSGCYHRIVRVTRRTCSRRHEPSAGAAARPRWLSVRMMSQERELAEKRPEGWARSPLEGQARGAQWNPVGSAHGGGSLGGSPRPLSLVLDVPSTVSAVGTVRPTEKRAGSPRTSPPRRRAS